MDEAIADRPDAAVAAAAGDGPWRADVAREVLLAIVERERHTLTANFIGILTCAISALALPYANALVVPLLLRVVAVTVTHSTCANLRRKLCDGAPHAGALRAVTAALCFGGITWGVLLWPIAASPDLHAPAFAIIGITAVAVSLIGALLGPLPKVLVGFVLCFLGATLVGLALAPGTIPEWTIVGVVGMVLGMVAFSLGSARHARSSAEMLVENRRLSDALVKALARAEFLSLRDPLTGLKNRRAFLEQSPAGKSADRVRHLLAIDLDHFKRINDEFGHAAGDAVLVEVGNVLRGVLGTLPPGEHCAVRLGGEEFVMVLEGFDEKGASGVAEMVRLAVANLTDGAACPGVAVSASIGLCEWAAGERLEPALLRADRALYRAKSDGRDRVIRHAA